MNQTFHFGMYTWDVDKAQSFVRAGRAESVRVPLAGFAKLIGLIRVDEEYAERHPTPDDPIILAALPSSGGVFHIPIDGWHRIVHWMGRDAETVSAFVLDPQDSYSSLIGGQEQYRKLFKKADPTVSLRASRRSGTRRP